MPSPAGMPLTKLSLWPGIIKLFHARESLVSDIPAGDGKMYALFYSVLFMTPFLQCTIPGNGVSRLVAPVGVVLGASL